MHARGPTFWHWPGWRNLGFATLLGLGVGLVFALVYGGADWVTEQHAHRVRLHVDADLAIPLVPGMAVFYLSLMPLLWMAPFVLRTRRELAAFALTLSAATIVAGVFFLILPAEDAYPPPEEGRLGRFAPVYHLATTLALRHNYFPSLHVAFTTICVLVYGRAAGTATKVVLGAWGAAIVASTLLAHQHYMLDVVSGLLLGGAAVHLVYRRCLHRQPEAGEIRPASQSTRPEPPA